MAKSFITPQEAEELKKLSADLISIQKKVAIALKTVSISKDTAFLNNAASLHAKESKIAKRIKEILG